MLDYWVRLHRQRRLPVEDVLVKSIAYPTEGVYEVGGTRHEFRVLRLPDEDPVPLLADEALLPLATLRSLAGAAASAPSMAVFAEAAAERAPVE